LQIFWTIAVTPPSSLRCPEQNMLINQNHDNFK
jgi:hypothetical protein